MAVQCQQGWQKRTNVMKYYILGSMVIVILAIIAAGLSGLIYEGHMLPVWLQYVVLWDAVVLSATAFGAGLKANDDHT